jgi:AcrR family transcriptional regulator
MTDTRRRILDVALACFLADGYEQTTIAEIRNRSGTSNGALFHHFPTKEAIADALYVDAIASFQQGLWHLVGRKPRSLRAAVHGAIAHQLGWTEQNADLARFVYARGHLDWSSPAGAELAALNRDLAAAFREWLAPFVASGEVRAAPMLLITAVVSGPAHAIAQRWLAGQVNRPLTSFVAALTDAAWAGLRGTATSGTEPDATEPAGAAPDATPPAEAAPAGAELDATEPGGTEPRGPAGHARPAPLIPARGRVTLELLSDDGSVLAHSQATTLLTPPEPPSQAE